MKKKSETPICRHLDMQKTQLPFMEAFHKKYQDQWSLGVDAMFDFIRNKALPTPKTVRQSALLRGCSGWLYWTTLLQGYAQYVEEGGVSESNTYLAFLPLFLSRTVMDLQLNPLAEDDQAVMAMTQRRLQMGVDMLQGDLNRHDPLAVVVGEPINSDFALVDSDGRELPCSAVDGIHRLFWAKFWRMPRFPYIQVQSADAIDASLRDFIEHKPDKTFFDYCRLGYAYSLQGDNDKSRTCFETAMRQGEQMLASLQAAATTTADPNSSPKPSVSTVQNNAVSPGKSKKRKR
jgi:hypothetical protein